MKFLYKVFITLFICLCVLIGSKKSSKFRDIVYKNVYDKNISFAYLNTLYNRYFGSVLPFKLGVVTPVFSDTLKYSDKQSYKDGVKLTVDNNYLVPAISSGLVIFKGMKDGISTVIILDSNGVETWYSNMNFKVNLYDYVLKGEYLGDTLDNSLYLIFKKDGEVLNYEEFI